MLNQTSPFKRNSFVDTDNATGNVFVQNQDEATNYEAEKLKPLGSASRNRLGSDNLHSYASNAHIASIKSVGYESNDNWKGKGATTLEPMAPKQLINKMRYKMQSVPRNKAVAPRPYPTDCNSATVKIVPPQGHFQGYQRSGMMLFNNINSYDSNAFNNNQTVASQTFG